MSADDSSGFHESAERMALLGQHKRNPDPTATDATVALPNLGSYVSVSQRLEVVLSQCQTDGEIDRELWDDLEIHHRSAHTYINQYLDCLQQVHEERCSHVYEIDDSHNEASPTDSNATAMTRAECRLKVSRDSLARDLLAMHETLEFLKKRTVPTPSKGGFSICALSVSASTLSLIIWRNFRLLETLSALAFDTVSLAAYYYSPEMRKWLRTESIEHYQGKIEALLRRLNKNELDEHDRAGLSGMWYWIVDKFRK